MEARAVSTQREKSLLLRLEWVLERRFFDVILSLLLVYSSLDGFWLFIEREHSSVKIK